MKTEFQQPEHSLPKTEPAIAVSGGYRLCRPKVFLGQYYDRFSGCVIKKWKEATPFGFVYFETIHYR